MLAFALLCAGPCASSDVDDPASGAVAIKSTAVTVSPVTLVCA